MLFTVWCSVSSAQQVNYGYVNAVTDHSAVIQYNLLTKDIADVKRIKIVTNSTARPNGIKINYSHTNLGGDTFLLRAAVTGLKPGFNYQVELGTNANSSLKFKTLSRPDNHINKDEVLRIAIGSCPHYERFYMASKFPEEFVRDKPKAISDLDSLEGYPVLEAIIKTDPLALISNGDNVYYDHPRQVKTVHEMRQKWHQQFMLPRMKRLLKQVPIIWNMDDHDYRGDDSDTTNTRYPFPSHRTAMGIFREQAPHGAYDALNNAKAGDGTTHSINQPPYRKIRFNAETELYILEGRVFRSPIEQSDDSNKTLWGKAQRHWLIGNLKSSTAKFKVIITPTPLVGPDDARKKDNHTNISGYQTEGNWFFRQLKALKLDTSEVILITGDRHWQYHSIHASGYHEIATGSMVTRNARIGRKPGDAASTDPSGKIRQVFIQPQPTGGFCLLTVKRAPGSGKHSLQLELISEKSELLHRYSIVR